MGLLMPRSMSAGAFASVAEYGNIEASKSPRYAFIFMRYYSRLTEHRYFALARFFAATPEVVHNPSFEIRRTLRCVSSVAPGVIP